MLILVSLPLSNPEMTKTPHFKTKGISIVNLVMNHIGHIVYEIYPDHDHSYCSQPKDKRDREWMKKERYSADLQFKKLPYAPITDDVLKYGFLILGIFEGRGSSSISTIPELPFNLTLGGLTPGTQIYLTYQSTPEVIRAFNHNIFHGSYAERDVILPKWFALGFEFDFKRRV